MSDTYTSTTGFTFEFRPISQERLSAALRKVETEFRDAGEPIDPPTYTVEIGSGGTEQIFHDETTIEEGETPEIIAEQKATWAKHVDARKRFKMARDRRALRLTLLRGVKLVRPAEIPDDGWDTRLMADGVEVPSDADERLLCWLKHEALPTPQDIFAVQRGVSLISNAGAPAEAIERIEEFFRDPFGNAGKRNASG